MTKKTMDKNALNKEIISTLASVQLETAMALSHANFGNDYKYVNGIVRRAKRRLNYILKLIQKEQKDARKAAESGQQAELPTAGGQQACNAQTAENAKQNSLLCTDAAQLTARKEES